MVFVNGSLTPRRSQWAKEMKAWKNGSKIKSFHHKDENLTVFFSEAGEQPKRVSVRNEASFL
jgi:hypothetical protein